MKHIKTKKIMLLCILLSPISTPVNAYQETAKRAALLGIIAASGMFLHHTFQSWIQSQTNELDKEEYIAREKNFCELLSSPLTPSKAQEFPTKSWSLVANALAQTQPPNLSGKDSVFVFKHSGRFYEIVKAFWKDWKKTQNLSTGYKDQSIFFAQPLLLCLLAATGGMLCTLPELIAPRFDLPAQCLETIQIAFTPFTQFMKCFTPPKILKNEKEVAEKEPEFYQAYKAQKEFYRHSWDSGVMFTQALAIAFSTDT